MSVGGTPAQLISAAQQNTAQNMPAGGGGKQPLLPFRRGTDLRLSPLIDTRTWAANTRLSSIKLPDVGFWDYLILQATGTYGAQNSGALAFEGPWNVMNRIQHNLNIGGGAIDDVSGWGGYLVSTGLERSFRNDASTFAGVYSAGTAAGTNTVNLTWFIPVSANPYINMDLGPINLQSDKLRATLDLTCGANTDYAPTATLGNGTGASLTLNAYYGYWEVPDPTQVQFPPLYVHRILEEAPSITQTGDTIYKVPRQGSLMRLWHTIVVNNARDSADLTQWRFVYDKTTTPELWTSSWMNQMYARKILGTDVPTGVLFEDRWHSQGFVGNGDFRDVIETLPVAELDSIITLATTAVLGVGNNFQQTIREFAEPLVQ